MSKVDEIKVATISERLPEGRGFLAVTDCMKTVFIIAKPIIEARLTIGHSVIVVLKPYRGYEKIDWFADWAVPHGAVTMESVQDAIGKMTEGFAWKAGDIGLDEGDLLYRAGIATKYIRLHKKKEIDSYEDIFYTLYPERVVIDEVEEDDEE